MTTAVAAFTPAQIERFHAKVDRAAGPDGCWPWLGYVDDRPEKGYGVWYYSNHARIGAHRAAWMIASGREVPAEHEIDHVLASGCTRRDCCNPAHLEAVTHEENMSRLPQACRKGHPVTGDNAVPASNGSRRARCRICRDENTRKNHAKNRSTTA